jgi:hypothetical protein
MHEDFRIGDSRFWKYHVDNYNPNHSDQAEDSLTQLNKKGKVQINVKKT